MSQSTVSVTVEQEILDLFNQINTLLAAMKSGESPLAAVLVEVTNLQKLVTDIQALPGDWKQSPTSSILAASVGGMSILKTLTGLS